MSNDPERIPIGTVGFDGPRARTFAKLDAVEVQDTFRGVPGSKLLSRMRREAGEGYFFILRAPLVLTQPADVGRSRPKLSYLPEGAWPDQPFDTGPAGQAAWGYLLEAAERIGAQVILLQTAPRFRPTQANRRRLAAFFEKVATPRPVRLAWDSQGLWSDEEQAALCRDLELLPCLDPLVQDAPLGGEAYLRVLGRSRSHHGLSADQLDRLHDAWESLSGGAVILNTPSPFRDATSLKRLTTA